MLYAVVKCVIVFYSMVWRVLAFTLFANITTIVNIIFTIIVL